MGVVTGHAAIRASGASIECQGISACAESRIRGKYVESISCDGSESCQNATFVITQPKRGFGLECLGSGSCNGLQIEINLEGPPVGFRCNPKNNQNTIQFGQIVCGKNACNGLEIRINNEGCDRVFIEEIQCLHPNSCENLQFNVIGNVKINRLECMAFSSCKDMTFVIESNVLIENINCANNACLGCVIKKSINDPVAIGTPCDPITI